MDRRTSYGEIRLNAVLVDLNVMLDVFLGRTQWLADSAAMLQANLDGRILGYVPGASLPTLYYVVRRNAELSRAHQVVSECLKSFVIVPIFRSTLELAWRLPGTNFEDNLSPARCRPESM